MAFNRATDEIQLEMDDMQDGILVGLQKGRQTFISFSITNVPAFQAFPQVCPAADHNCGKGVRVRIRSWPLLRSAARRFG
jgi:hypothetical protein